MKTPGITVRPLVNMAGQPRASTRSSSRTSACPRSNLVGEENRGWYVGMTHARLRALEHRLHRRATSASSKLLVRDMQGAQPGGAYRDILRNRLRRPRGSRTKPAACLSYRIVWMQEAGRIPNYEASMVKLFAPSSRSASRTSA